MTSRSILCSLSLLALLAPSVASASPRVLAAEHRGRLSGESMTWQSRLVLSCDGESAVHLEGAEPRDVECARTVTVQTTQTIPKTDRDHVTLAPPIAIGEGAQLVLVEGDGDARFEPSSAMRVEKHVGYAATTDVRDDARHRADELLGREPLTPGPEPLYIVVSTPAGATLTGAIKTAAERQRPAVWAISLGSLAVVLLLVFVYRWAKREAAFERAERVIREEFEGLEPK
jgi:hypothetical protein